MKVKCEKEKRKAMITVHFDCNLIKTSNRSLATITTQHKGNNKNLICDLLQVTNKKESEKKRVLD